MSDLIVAEWLLSMLAARLHSAVEMGPLTCTFPAEADFNHHRFVTEKYAEPVGAFLLVLSTLLCGTGYEEERRALAAASGSTDVFLSGLLALGGFRTLPPRELERIVQDIKNSAAQACNAIRALGGRLGFEVKFLEQMLPGTAQYYQLILDQLYEILLAERESG